MSAGDSRAAAWLTPLLPTLPTRDAAQDGHEWIALLEHTPWAPVPQWGRDGWLCGRWPYVVVAVCAVPLHAEAQAYGLAVYVEGDLEVRAYESREDLVAAVDDTAAFYWRLEQAAEVPPAGPLPAKFSGMFSWERAAREAEEEAAC